MKQRAIKDLCQLSEQLLFREVSVGIDLAIANALAIEIDARSLYGAQSSSYDILISIACEEAAKALILFDAVRCPWRTPNFLRQIQRFYDHLAKGIYAEMCELEPSSKGDLQKHLELARQKTYSDGPNDDDWIFPNRILHSRERNMYVDYVKCDDEHLWLSPFRNERFFEHRTPRVVAVVKSLKVTGCTTPESLASIAAKWRSVSIDEHCTRQELRELNHDTLNELKARNLLDASDASALETIIRHLPFPLHDVEMTLLALDNAGSRLSTSAKDVV